VIVVDSSAVIAIFRQEDEAEKCARSVAADDDPIISAANLVEISIVLRGLKKIAPEKAERWLDDFIKAHLRFGKGTGHRAALNYGDCFAYALAKTMDASLLCKGNDFRLTDIRIA
jgi:ribonuclease VapC